MPAQPTRPSYKRAAILAALSALVTAGILTLAWPAGRPLVGYGLYAVAAHLLISVVPNEPMLLATAKTQAPAFVAIAGTLGCIVAIIIDYALLGWLVNHRFVRREIDDSGGFRWAQKYFGKVPFLIIALSALAPIPFWPAKILAIVRDYPRSRFCLALVVGRLPRFYWLAVLGQKVKVPDSALASAGVSLALMAGWGVWRTYRRNRIAAGNSGQTKG